MIEEHPPSQKQDIHTLLMASKVRFALVPFLAAATFYPMLFVAMHLHMDLLQASLAAFVGALLLPLILSMHWWTRTAR